MKYLRRLLVIAGLIVVGVVVVSRDIPGQLAGDASQALQVYYNIKKADEINSREILVYIDKSLLSAEQSAKPFMEEDMDLTIPLESASKLFDCTVDVLDDGTVRFTKDGTALEVTEELKTRSGKTYVPVSVLAEAFDYTYEWNEQVNGLYINSPDGGTSLADLPSAYDMRDDDRLTPVRSQGNLGTCWAFAALSAFESTLAPDEMQIFAVDHMSILSGFNINQYDGGDYNMAVAYMASWKGPVLEADDPYGDNQTDEALESVKHLQETRIVAANDYDTIKEMIYTTGGVQSSFYSDMETANSSSQYYNLSTYSYYYMGEEVPNHDIVIIGWDDTYPKENFNNIPSEDGAFLCRNSWGIEFGKEGYFWISYEDTNIGVNNIVYTRIDDTDNYDTIYQADLLGWVGSLGYGSESAYFSNVYRTEEAERLQAVSFYTTDLNSYYDIYIVRNFEDADSFSEMEYLKSGYISNSGYYTIDIEKEVLLEAGSRFAVVVRIETENAEHPVAIEYEASELTADVDISDGEGYISYEGQSWEWVEGEYGCNICLKVFTDKY